MYDFITCGWRQGQRANSNLCFLLVIFLYRARRLTFTDDVAIVPVYQGDEGHHQRPEEGTGGNGPLTDNKTIRSNVEGEATAETACLWR
jgi:hypothetical protein